MLTTGYSSWLWLAFYFLSLSLCVAQSSASGAGQATSTQLTLQTSAPSQAFQSALTSLLANQQTLAQQMDSLLAQGATGQQIQAWQQQNGAEFTALHQAALNLTLATPAQTLTYVTDITIPPSASANLTNLLSTQGDLYNRYVELHNQLVQSGASTASEMASFQQQNAAEIQAQQQVAQSVAAENDAQALPVPPPLVIPTGASSQMRAFLTLRDQLTRAQIQVHNQNLTTTSTGRAAAIQQWMQQHATSFQQLQQLSQNLSTTTPQN